MRLALPGPLADLARYPMRRAELWAHLTRPYRTRRLHTFDEETILQGSGGVLGAHKIAIGSNSLILAGVQAPAFASRLW